LRERHGWSEVEDRDAIRQTVHFSISPTRVSVAYRVDRREDGSPPGGLQQEFGNWDAVVLGGVRAG